MPEITLYRNIWDAKETAHHVNLDTALERIRTGKSKIAIDAVRLEHDKDKRNILKKNLVSILFAGTFKLRNDDSLIQHSGFIVLDFDSFLIPDDVEDFKNEMKEDKHVYSVFISPSGNGVKALVKIPECDKEEHKLYFTALESYFDSRYFDTSGKNISRVCYESYDPEIFINKDSEIWTTKAEDSGYKYTERSPDIPVTDQDKIITKLMKWWNSKFGYVKGERNNNLFKLAAAFNDYGIDSHTAKEFLLSSFDLPESEINLLHRSAYSKTANFGTVYFEDADRIKSVKINLNKGVPKEEIRRQLSKDVSDEVANSIIDKLKDATDCYWTITTTDRGEKVSIDHAAFKLYLQSNGFFKYYPEKAEQPFFVQVTSNIVQNSSVDKIKDFVLQELEDNKTFNVWNFMAASSKCFNDKYLNMLDSIALCMLEDTADNGFIYYKNGVAEIRKDEVILHEYMDVDGYIWQNQIIDRDYKASDNITNDFQDMVSKISAEDPDRIAALESTLGYLMHSFKSKTDQKSIIFNDEEINDNPNGGSGKSLMLTALSNFKRVVKIDGKHFDPSRSDFLYQRVNLDTQILAFDDVKKRFNMEHLFSLITEGITVNRKNKDEIFIPFERSPKLVITTNYVIGGSGHSHDRRRHEIEFNQYFNGDNTPLDEYGKLLFDDWSVTEWICFDNYMIGLLQEFLSTGLITGKSINADVKRFMQSTSKEVFEWFEDELPINEKTTNNSFKITFSDEFKDYKNITTKKLLIWIDLYCKLKGYELEKGKDSDRWFKVVDTTNNKTYLESMNMEEKGLPY